VLFIGSLILVFEIIGRMSAMFSHRRKPNEKG
jgi:hypothetical protein